MSTGQITLQKLKQSNILIISPGNWKKQRSTLENLDKSKSDFIAVAAHELKTPLTLIEGYASMLKDLFPKDNESGIILLQGMDNGIKRLQDIVNDMIDVSLIDNDMLKINYQPVWIKTTFRDR